MVETILDNGSQTVIKTLNTQPFNFSFTLQIQNARPY